MLMQWILMTQQKYLGGPQVPVQQARGISTIAPIGTIGTVGTVGTVGPVGTISTAPVVYGAPPTYTTVPYGAPRTVSAFDMMDRNHDGVITRAEFDPFAMIDRDGDGVITRAELAAAPAALR